MKTSRVAFCVLLALASASRLSAQRFTVDLRGAFAVPAEKLSGAELGNGFGIGATLAARVQPHLHVYGGWDWLLFKSKNAIPELDYEETGYTFGLRFQHPISDTSGTSIRVEAGGTYKHTEVENSDGKIIANSGHGMGFEAAAGLVTPMRAGFSVVGMLRYRSRSNEFTVSNVTSKGNLSYVGVEIGVSRTF